MTDELTVFAGDASIRCGKSVPEFAAHPELQGRHCIRPAGHDGYHIAQRDDETHAQTIARCLDTHIEQEATPHG